MCYIDLAPESSWWSHAKGYSCSWRRVGSWAQGVMVGTEWGYPLCRLLDRVA